MNSDRANAKCPIWTQPALRWAMCLAALLVAALAVGAVARATTASSDPDWGGSDPELISHGSADEALWPAIAVNSTDQVAVIWSDERGSTRDIYFTKYNLVSWSAPQAITSTVPDSTQSDLLAVGNTFFAAWIEPTGSKVYATELGSGEISDLTTPNPPVDDSRPSLAATPDRLHVAFSVGDSLGVPDLYLATRPLASTSWTFFDRIYESPALLGAWWPAMAAGPNGQTLHLVWEERAASKTRAINYISGTVSGGSVSWSTTPDVLSTGHEWAIRPDIAVDADGNAHVVWTEIGAGGFYEQYVRYTRLDVGSDSWPPSRQIDSNHAEANQEAPTFVAARVAAWTDGESGETTVCAAWHGFRDGDPMAEEALLTCSPDGGNTWNNTQNVSRSTTTAGEEVSIRPDIAFDSSGDLHVAWQEFAVGGDIQYDYEIYYAHGGVGSGPVYLPLVLRGYP